MKERSVSERRAGWSFGRTMSSFWTERVGLGSDGEYPLRISSDPKPRARGGGVSWSNACNRGSGQEISATPLRHARKRHLVSNFIRARRPSRCSQQVNYCFSLWCQKGVRSPQVARRYLWSASPSPLLPALVPRRHSAPSSNETIDG